MKNLFVALTALLLVVVIGCSDTPTPVASTDTQTENVQTIPLAKGEESGIVPNSYIVILSSRLPDVASTKASERLTQLEEKIDALKDHFPFEVTNRYDACLTGFAAKMDAKTAESLSHDSRIERIEPDRYAYAFAQTVPTGVNRIDAEITPTTASNVEIYVIDTGIQPDHPDLNVITGANFVDGANGNANWQDGHGHGTHVAGTAAAINNTSYVLGVTPQTNLFAVRVLNNAGSGQYSWIIAGVNWVTGRKSGNPKAMVANMSLGGYTGSTSYNSLDVAVKNSITAGVTYAIAAGNSSKDAKYYSPAHVTEALTVGAYDPTKNKWASFSNKGSIVDILAPGVKILSTYKGSSTATMSGTSMSSPHVAGTAALYLQTNPTATPTQVRTALLNAASNPNPGPNPLITSVPGGTTKTSVYAGNF